MISPSQKPSEWGGARINLGLSASKVLALLRCFNLVKEAFSVTLAMAWKQL